MIGSSKQGNLPGQSQAEPHKPLTPHPPMDRAGFGNGAGGARNRAFQEGYRLMFTIGDCCAFSTAFMCRQGQLMAAGEARRFGLAVRTTDCLPVTLLQGAD